MMGGCHSTSSQAPANDSRAPGGLLAEERPGPSPTGWLTGSGSLPWDRTLDGALDRMLCDWCYGPIPPDRQFSGTCSGPCAASLSLELGQDPGQGPVACKFCGLAKDPRQMCRRYGTRRGVRPMCVACKSQQCSWYRLQARLAVGDPHPVETAVTRTCRRCREAKEFCLMVHKAGKPTTLCRACKSAYNREHHRALKAARLVGQGPQGARPKAERSEAAQGTVVQGLGLEVSA